MVKIRSKSFSLFIFFFWKKIQQTSFFQSFFVSHFFSHHFSFFLSSLSLFDHFFPFIFLFHLFLLFSPSFLSFSSFFLYFPTSVFLFLFFLSHVFFLFFHRRFCVSSFCFNTHLFFSLFCSWSHSSFLPSSLFFSSFPYLFLPNQIQIFLFFEKYGFFWTLSLLCRFLPCLFHVFWFFAFLDITFLFFVNNLLFGHLKNCRFVFWKKLQKSSLVFLFHSP